MAPQNNDKPKRRKKRKSRTEVSSDSDSETSPATEQPSKKFKSPPEPTTLSDAEVDKAFTKFYMQRLTTEFEDDLDKLRKADDFKDDALEILIGALQQGTSMFGMGEKRRIVEAGMGKKGE
ncbi:uncharacterized protein LY89DRAFT_735814 [Mollisia scopiformis]|uniref:Ribosome assembly protein 3 n=1 Tax=Mollisia scopiformis TaxID=149040 RepID=A0A194X4I6_MOLSC|nr:uncharacterized protein LY89DRAFT_735814 [Mollisia scopiformis]KUJ14737.1 hypothetical protein LY89DRAFT_735814 [Mollisia scopiformis]